MTNRNVRYHSVSSRAVRLCAAFLLVCGFTSISTAQELTQKDIDQMVARGVNFLKGVTATNASGGEASLSAYALVKGGLPKSDPIIKGVIAGVKKKITSDGYKPRNHGLYEAGVDAMLLEAVDGENNKQELKSIVDYILKEQLAGGGWFYPEIRDVPHRAGGDTSIAQYSVLGLWAAHRAGVEFPLSALDAAAKWHIKSQLGNGAFGYQPTRPGENSQPRHTMGVAATGSMLIIARILFPEEAGLAPKKPKADEKKFGILKQDNIDDTSGPAGSPNSNFSPSVSVAALKSSAMKGLQWVNGNFRYQDRFTMYNMYAVERMASLAKVEQLRGVNWFRVGVLSLQKAQQSDGSWNMDGQHGGKPRSTAFAILFLVRATGKTVGAKPLVPAGTGLMIGGRGLPDDLGEITMKDGEVQTQKVSGPLDEMLANLGKLDNIDQDLDAVQAAIVEKVQIGDREALIGQKENLIRYVEHPNVEVRRTSVWALGRCEDLKLANLMIKTLDDPDLSVAQEAHNALCVLTRQPQGPTLEKPLQRIKADASNFPEAPLDGYEDASEKIKIDAATRWRRDAKIAWQSWYNQIRPYEERDDINELIDQVE